MTAIVERTDNVLSSQMEFSLLLIMSLRQCVFFPQIRLHGNFKILNLVLVSLTKQKSKKPGCLSAVKLRRSDDVASDTG